MKGRLIMGQKVIIVESPSKSKTIGSYLNHEAIVLSSVGHIRDLKTSGPSGLGVDIENKFKPDYGISKGKSKVVSELIKKTKGKEVLIATDPDREGEAIAWHLAEVLGLDLNDKNRIVFREITKPAVMEAMKTPRKIDQDLVNSQEARRILDRIIGFKLSTLLQRKIKSKSAGRVQSVALKLIVDLEREIKAFIPEEYHNIYAFFKDFKADYIVKKDHKIKEAEASTIVSESINPFVVTDITSKETKRNAKVPFITSTLQQDAVNNLNMSSSRVMGLAQKLYEGIEIDGELTGLITYMRTDSTRLSPLFVGETQTYIENVFGKAYLGTYKTNNKDSAQDAHEAIRPTSVHRTPASMEPYLEKDEFKLYKRIYERAVASLMSAAVYQQSKVILTANEKYHYQIEGSILKFDGYQKVFNDGSKDKLLPKVELNQKLDALKVEAEKKFTLPPARYNEASLIKDLEAKGIGRPSTYATIIKTLKDRGYVELQEKRFHPTDQGTLTSDQLDLFFNSIINVDYTSKMESDLDLIAEGKSGSLELLSDFYRKFVPLLENANEKMDQQQPVVTDEICPLCGSHLVVRKSKYGEFLGCSSFPKCRYIGEYKK